MTDIRLGVTLPQFTDDTQRLLRAARAAEDAGLDSVWLFDHMWPLSGGKERPFMEQWTALAAVAASTTTIGVGTLVTRSSLRHPALTAKMAATVGAIAPGRVTVGLGTGDQLSRAENEAFGLPYYSGRDRLQHLRSEVDIIAAYLAASPVSRSDRFHRVERLPPSPRPSPPPALWLGGRTPQLIEMAAERADGWNAWGGDAAAFGEDAALALDAAGKRRFELSWAGIGVLESDDAAARERAEGRPERHVVGGPATFAAGLARFIEAGARHVIVTFPAATPERYRRLAEEVAPRLAAR